MDQRLALRLVRSPAAFPAPFSTYVPDDMLAEFAAADSGYSVRFIANFAAQRNDTAYALFYFYPPATTLPVARDYLEGFLDGLVPGETPATPELPPAWAELAYHFRYHPPGTRWVTGMAALGRHADYFFHYISQYPEEFGDGMASRLDLILREWRWLDTGRPLLSPQTGPGPKPVTRRG